MTDTPLDLDYIEHRMASPMVTYRESVEEDMPALVAALRKAEAQVAAVLALCDQADARLGQGNSLTPTAVRAAVDGAS